MVAANAAHLTFVTDNMELYEVLDILFSRLGASIADAIVHLPSALTYTSIVCMPPLGLRHPGNKGADGFGGEIVRELVPYLSKEGTLYWVTGRGVLFNPSAERTIADLKVLGLHGVGCIEILPGAFLGTLIEGVVIVLQYQQPKRRFVGALRDKETAEPTAGALLAGPTGKDGPNWSWLNPDDRRTFFDVEKARLLQTLTPRGRYTLQRLGSLLHNEQITKADTPIIDTDSIGAFLSIPEYAGSRVTARLDEQTVKPKAVYRLSVDPAKANPRFLALLLNGPYGKQLREYAARGVTIQRVSASNLRELKLPTPVFPTQGRIARIGGDLSLLQSKIHDLQAAADQDWSLLWKKR